MKDIGENKKHLPNKNFFAILTFCLLLLTVFSVENLFAARVYLKKGSYVEGNIFEENEYRVKIFDTENKKVITIKREDIKQIQYKAVDPTMKDLKNKKSTTSSPSELLGKLQPRIGALIDFSMSMGDIGPYLQPGVRAGIFTDLRVPMPSEKLAPLDIRFGLSIGAFWMGTTTKAAGESITGIPILLHFKLGYIFSVGVKPYLNIAYGGSYMILGSNTALPSDVSAFDSTIEFGIGLGYTHPKIPNVEFILLDLNFYLITESIMGYFISAGVGFAFNFGIPSAGKK